MSWFSGLFVLGVHLNKGSTGKMKSNKTPQFLKVRPSRVDRIPDEVKEAWV